MDEKPGEIQVAYEHSCSEMGEKIVHWMTESDIAKLDEKPTESESGFIVYHLTALKKIAMDAAVVLVSDEATGNREWHDFVKNLPMSVRLIPVGGIQEVNYNDPEVLPPRIEEINFIHMDDKCKVNILDSLVTDPKFYAVKNLLLLKYNSWFLNKNKGSLLTGRKEIKQYQALFEQNYSEDKDEYLKKQIQGIQKYLKASNRYTWELVISAVWRWVKRSVWIVVAIIIVYALLKFRAFYSRAAYANKTLSLDTKTDGSVTSVLKLAEMMTNPFVEKAAQTEAYQQYVELISRPWEQTPIGLMYRHAITDVAIPLHTTQYIWTSDAGGKALLWDTFTGELVSDVKVADSGLAAIAVSGSGNTVLTLDYDGHLYRRIGESWEATGWNSSVNVNNLEMRIDDERALLFDSNRVELFTSENTYVFVAEEQGWENIGTAGIGTDGMIRILGVKDGKTVFLNWSGKAVLSEQSFDIENRSYLVMDIFEDTALVIASDGQVWLLKGENSERVPLVLPKVIYVRLINDHTILYHDRNMGTGLYDFAKNFDYGDVFSGYPTTGELYATEDLAVFYNGFYIPFPIRDILRVGEESVDLSSAVKYEGRSASSDAVASNGFRVMNLEINEIDVMIMKVLYQGKEEGLVVDPAHIIRSNRGYYSEKDAQLFDPNLHFYPQEAFSIKGVPTTVGIRFVPAGRWCDEDLFLILVGGSDGSFTEVSVSQSDGTMIRTAYYQTPSRAPIRAVYQTEDGYILEDEDRNLWQCRSGKDTFSMGGLVHSIKEKLHSGITEPDMETYISPELREMLDLKSFPGGDGKEWG